MRILLATIMLAACGTKSEAPVEPKKAPVETKAEVAPAPEKKAGKGCDWDSARLPSTDVELPTEITGDLPGVIEGSWQHTHTVAPDGTVKATLPTSDLRYVLTAKKFHFCQRIDGGSPSENVGFISWEGNVLSVNDGVARYTVLAANADTLVWGNQRIEGEKFVLRRR